MKARYALYTILTLATFAVLPQTVSADTIYFDNTPTTYPNSFIPSLLIDDGDGVYDAGSREMESILIEYIPDSDQLVNQITLGQLRKTTNPSATATGCDADVDLCESTAYLTVWKTSSSTYATDKTYITAKSFELTDTYAEIEINFPGGFYFVNGDSYVLEITYGSDPSNWWLSHQGGKMSLQLATSTFDYTTVTPIAFDSFDDTHDYSANHYNKIGLIVAYTGTGIEQQDIILSDPCETDNYSYPCTYGLASTTEYVTITGTSTLNSSITSNTYNLTGVWVSSNGNVFDSTIAIVNKNNNPVHFELTLYRPYSREVSTLGFIYVCQNFDDLSIMSGYSTLISDPTLCARIIIGNDISTASTTAVAGELGLLDPVTNADLGWTGSLGNGLGGTTGGSDDLFEWDYWLDKVSTIGVFAFWLPFMYHIQNNVTPDAVNYAGDLISNYTTEISTTTDIVFNIPLNMSAFGLPTTTAALPITSMLQYAETQSPNLFQYINYFLWGLFWLFILSRILSGAWHPLDSARSGSASGGSYGDRLMRRSANRDRRIRDNGYVYNGKYYKEY